MKDPHYVIVGNIGLKMEGPLDELREKVRQTILCGEPLISDLPNEVIMLIVPPGVPVCILSEAEGDKRRNQSQLLVSVPHPALNQRGH